jgi:hypothetical protein
MPVKPEIKGDFGRVSGLVMSIETAIAFSKKNNNCDAFITKQQKKHLFGRKKKPDFQSN